MIEFINLSGAAGSVEVYVAGAPSVASGLADLTVRPRYGSEVEVTLNASECRELSDVLTRAAEALEA